MTTTLQGIVRGSRRAKIQDGDILKREFIETYIVTSDDGTDDEGHVYATTGLPVIGDAWTGQGGSTNPGTYVVSVTISDHDATKKRWEVEVEYSSELPDNGSNTSGGGTNPLNFDPEIEWDTEFEEEAAIHDNAGNPIVNSAKDVPMHPPITRMVPILSLRYSKWMSSYSALINLTYSGKTNSDVFLGFPPGSALMGAIRARAEFIYGLQYWWVTYPIKFRFDAAGVSPGWVGWTYDVGPNYLDGGTKKSAMVDLPNPKPITNLVFNTGAATDNPPTRLQFDIYYRVPFTPIL